MPESHPQLRVLVLLGGPSDEREISLLSGESVCTSLESAGHHVTRFDPQEEHLAGVRSQDFDVAFIALHGRYGEDGAVQRQLEAIGLPYTGSNPAASSLAFDKCEAKRRFDIAGVPTPEWVSFQKADTQETIQQRIRDSNWGMTGLTTPPNSVVIKPARQGSSIGVTFAQSWDQLQAGIQHALQYDELGLIERAIAGEEWTVPFLDDQAFPPIRIGTARAFFDYEAKYLSDETSYEFPEPSPLGQHIVDVAKNAVSALGVTGVSRVDLRVDPDGQPWVLEVNTVPGLTDHSLTPKSAARAGLSLAQLCETACRKAMERQAVPRSNRQNPPTEPTIDPLRRAS